MLSTTRCRCERPELFLKAVGRRVVGHGQPVRIRSDSRWNVPEPELVLVLNQHLEIVGYTAGNDVSSRDIEGERRTGRRTRGSPSSKPRSRSWNGASRRVELGVHGEVSAP
jgi:2-keto-4-pentenoate hydratase/2-oxohepta-3-ene-1,7-dioic acid hydratase in catechol pathway